jgi:hypothetical protein
MKPSPKTSVQHRSTFAKGDTGHMIKAQSAGPARPASTGKTQSVALGAKSAKGGPRTSGHSLSTPAKAGRTGPVRKDR